MILAVVAQFMAVITTIWLIWPLSVGPIYYSEQSFPDTDRLTVLPIPFAPYVLILARTVTP